MPARASDDHLAQSKSQVTSRNVFRASIIIRQKYASANKVLENYFTSNPADEETSGAMAQMFSTCIDTAHLRFKPQSTSASQPFPSKPDAMQHAVHNFQKLGETGFEIVPAAVNDLGLFGSPQVSKKSNNGHILDGPQTQPSHGCFGSPSHSDWGPEGRAAIIAAKDAQIAKLVEDHSHHIAHLSDQVLTLYFCLSICRSVCHLSMHMSPYIYI